MSRENKPVSSVKEGVTYWRLDGKLHRLDGPAVIHEDGSYEWYFEGDSHRVGGPAIEYADGEKHWFLHGLLHNENGPASIYPDGDIRWRLDDIQYSFEEWKIRRNYLLPIPIACINTSPPSKNKPKPTIIVL